MRQDHLIFLADDSDEDTSRPPSMVTMVEADEHHDGSYSPHKRDSDLRPVNLKFLTLAAVGLLVSVWAVHSLHGYQVRHMASYFLRQADAAFVSGQPQKAVEHLRGYLRLEPEDWEARDKLAFTMADIAETGKQRYDVFLLLERILRDDPTRRDVRRRLVDITMSGGRFADAIEHLKLLIVTAPKDDQLQLLLARSYRAIGEDLKAAAAYDDAIRCAPRAFNTYEELAELLDERLDESERAREVINQMVAAGTNSHQAYLARARFLQRRGQIESAEADAQRALHFGPDDPNVLQFVAGLIASNGNQNRKFNINVVSAGLIGALDRDPSAVPLIVAIARLDAHRGRYDLAEQRLKDAIQDHPRDLQLRWELAGMLVLQSKSEDARLEMAGLGERKLARPLEDFLAGRIAMSDGQWLAAVRKFESVRLSSAAAFPALLPQTSLCLGQCYEKLGHVEQQLAAYRDATNLNESSDEARLGLARSLSRMGRIDEALLHYGQLRHVSGVEIQIARLLITQNLQLPASERNWDEVEQALDAAAKTDLPNSLVVRSFLLVARDQHAQALQLLQRGIERHPGHVGLRIALAEAHYQMGSLSQVESVMQAAHQTLGNRVEILLARIRYAAALTGDEAEAKLRELEESAKQVSGASQIRVRQALAAAAAAMGDLPRWQMHLEAAVEQNPDDLLVVRSLFSGALQAGSAEEAERWLQEIRRIDGDDGPETRLAEAGQLMLSADSGSAEQARELLDKVAEQMPGSPRVALALAQLESLAGRDDLAIDHYTRAIDFGETDPSVFNRLIQLLYKQRRYTEAADVVERLRSTTSVSLSGQLGRVAAEVSVRSQDLEQARRFAELAVSSESQDYRDHLWLGQILWAAGDSEQAEQALRQAISLAPEQHEPWIALIQFLGRSGRTPEAEQELSNLRPRLSVEDAPYTLGQCYEALNQPQQAEQQYQLALKTHPNDEQVLWSLADLYLRSARLSEAEDLLRKLITSGPSASIAASARRAAAMVFTMRHGYRGFQEGLALLEKNLENAGGTTADRRMKAKLLATRPSHRQRREAITLLETLDDKGQFTLEDHVQLIRLYVAENEVDQARPYMAALLQSHGNNPEFIALCVSTLLQQGETSETVMVWLEKLEQLQPDQFRTVELRARALAAQNKSDEALTLLRQLASRPGEDAEQHDQQMGRVAFVLADLAAGFDRTGRPQLAEPLAKAAEDLYRDIASRRPERIVDLIRFLGRHWQPEKAFALCESAWQKAPPQAVAATCVELLRTREATQEQLQQVQRWIQNALLRDPESAELLFHLGNAAHLAGDYANAETMYRRAFQKASKPALVMLAANELALLLALHRHETDEAIPLINRAIEISGPLSFLLDTRATVYLAAGDAGKAKYDLEQAIADAPTAANQFHLAQAHLMTGDETAARAAWRESMSLGLHLAGIHPLEKSVFEELNAKLK